MKEQNKAMTRNLRKAGTIGMPDREFRVTLIRMIIGPETIKNFRETLTIELRNCISELKRTINETVNRCDAMNHRVEEAKEQIGDLEGNQAEGKER